MVNRRWQLTVFLLATALFSLQVVPRFNQDAPITDEIRDVVNGYFCWKGEVLGEITHPPLGKALQAVPLLVQGIRTPEALARFPEAERLEAFLVRGGLDRVGRVVRSGRWMTFLFGVGIGLLLFFAVRRRPPAVFLIALTLWAFEPTLLAFSGFAKSDVLLAFFGLSFFMALLKATRTGSAKWAAGAGGLAGMAVTTKFSAVAMVPAWLILEWLESRRGRAEGVSPLGGRRGLWMGLGFLALVGLVYLPAMFHAQPFHLPWFYFGQGFRRMWDYSSHPVFFLGGVARTSHLLYYPAVLFLKTTLPFSALLLAGWTIVLSRRASFEQWTWLPGAVFFLAMIPSLNTGMRNLLPAVPFFILTAAEAGGQCWKEFSPVPPGVRTAAIAILLAAHAASVLSAYPSHMSYFNDLVPASAKVRLLGDSNLDLGQDHKRFAQFAKARGWRDVRFGMFLGESPVRYGLDGRAWREADFTGPEPGRVYAYNAAFIQLAPGYFPEMTVLRDGWWHRAPFKRFMDTWYYLEIPSPGR